MSRSKIDRNKLIIKATELFKERGYHNTSMNDIALACDLRKASLYHHIPSRKALVIKVVESTLESFHQLFQNIYSDENLSLRERLALLADNIEKYFLESPNSCLLRNLAIEIADTIPEIRELAKVYYNKWLEAINHLLSQHFPHEKVKQLAEEIVTQIHGSLLLSDVCKDDGYFKRAVTRLTHLLD